MKDKTVKYETLVSLWFPLQVGVNEPACFCFSRGSTRQRNDHFHCEWGGSSQRDGCEAEVHLHLQCSCVTADRLSGLVLPTLSSRTRGGGICVTGLLFLCYLFSLGYELLKSTLCFLEFTMWILIFQVFYYSRRAFPPTAGHFRKRVVWSGDIQKQDASITLLQVSSDFNGTYSCRVLNPPDVHGRYGEVKLRVVNKAGRLFFIPGDTSCRNVTQFDGPVWAHFLEIH